MGFEADSLSLSEKLIGRLLRVREIQFNGIQRWQDKFSDPIFLIKLNNKRRNPEILIIENRFQIEDRGGLK